MQTLQLDLAANTSAGQGPVASDEEKAQKAQDALTRARTSLAETEGTLWATADQIPPVAAPFHRRLLASVTTARSAADALSGPPLPAVETLFDVLLTELDFGTYPESTELTELMNLPGSGCEH